MSDLSAAQLADLVAKAKLVLRIEDDDEQYLADGIAVFNDSGDAVSTVAVTEATVVLVDDGGTTTLTMADADKDTLTEMTAAIEATAGWQATLLGKSDVASTLLVRKAATSVIGQANETILQYENQSLLELLITNTST